VFALTPFDRDGVAADYTALPTELLVARPRALGHAEIAAIPVPALAAWQGLFDHGRLRADERVLIHGAAGGVGGFAVQLARAGGAHVIGTASAANLGLVRELGAHQAVDAATRIEDAVEPVDVVFDTAGGERLRRSLAVLRAGGRLVSVAEEPPDGGVRFIVEPNRDELTSLARLADVGELRPPPSRSSRSRRRARRSRAAWSRADEARLCWPSCDGPERPPRRTTAAWQSEHACSGRPRGHRPGKAESMEKSHKAARRHRGPLRARVADP
jgi:NADPH:quinone reductase-like Zn-dependent oxidoreductase